MRGKGVAHRTEDLRTGITPAYAGKSGSASGAGSPDGDHPRVCGEKASHAGSGVRMVGSPPRLRGKEGLCRDGLLKLGITPAYAGKSSLRGLWSRRPEDHPRVCGEKLPVVSS